MFKIQKYTEKMQTILIFVSHFIHKNTFLCNSISSTLKNQDNFLRETLTIYRI